jgi:WD40 repeat protein
MVTVWDLESRSLRWGPFRVDPWGAAGLSISADTKLLATAGLQGGRLWDLDTGAARGRIGDGSAGGAGAVAFSPNEPLVGFVRGGFGLEGPVEGGGDAEIWDVARRSRIATLKVDTTAGHEGYVLGWTIAFSPDGKMLATGGADPLVHLWEVSTGKLIRELEQNVGNAVWELEFSPDGSILAMSGGDPYASLWNVATGEHVGPRLGGVGSREATVDLSSDGRRMLMTHGDGRAAVWDVDPESWAKRACALANRTLTRPEWEQFLPGRRYDPACTS